MIRFALGRDQPEEHQFLFFVKLVGFSSELIAAKLLDSSSDDITDEQLFEMLRVNESGF
ncbi:hypothetical protein IH781_01625 [Patescibacteria group bacterium]|nr:hypothetical protein [Patescibacteria group bacterium]